MQIDRSVSKIISKLVLSALLAVPLLLSGCLEEKDSLTVYPDGSGVLHIHKKFGEVLSQMVSSNATPDKIQAAIDKSLYRELSLWSGVTAWTDCKASLDGKLVIFDAAAFFADLSVLKRTEGTSTQTFSWDKNSDGGFNLVWNNVDPSNQNPLDKPATPPAQAQQMLAMMKGLNIDHELVLPGAVLTAVGAGAHSGRTATAELADKNIADYFALLDNYRSRVDKGEITKAQANSEVATKMKAMSLDLQVTCGPGGDNSEFTEFTKAFDAAKADYGAKGTAQKIQNATKG
jgi:hypothetical protein